MSVVTIVHLDTTACSLCTLISHCSGVPHPSYVATLTTRPNFVCKCLFFSVISLAPNDQQKENAQKHSKCVLRHYNDTFVNVPTKLNKHPKSQYLFSEQSTCFLNKVCNVTGTNIQFCLLYDNMVLWTCLICQRWMKGRHRLM